MLKEDLGTMGKVVEGCVDEVADRGWRFCVCVCVLECILISVNFTAELTQLSVC